MFNEISLMAGMIGAIIFAIGGGAGFFIARQIKDKHTLGLEKQLETTQNQLSEYQGEVNRHFLKTSLLFNKLTDNYREVYEHLATGAQRLCNDKPLTTALDLPETKILSAAVAAGTSATIANEKDPEINAAPTNSGHDNALHSDDETNIAAEKTVAPTEIIHAEGSAPPETENSVLSEKTGTEQTTTKPAIMNSAITATEIKKVSAAKTTDDVPTITEAELKVLEASEQKKGEEEDIHLGAESTPSVELEHHKTHPSIH